VPHTSAYVRGLHRVSCSQRHFILLLQARQVEGASALTRADGRGHHRTPALLALFVLIAPTSFLLHSHFDFDFLSDSQRSSHRD
jgi:hypothetical protein